LFNDALGTIPHRDIQTGRSILSAIKKKEIMLFFPYHPFDYFIDLLRESSIDPYVTSIQITLYRLARNSSRYKCPAECSEKRQVSNNCCRTSGPDSTKKPIFSGEINFLAKGVKVIYGVPGLKVHSKLVS